MEPTGRLERVIQAISPNWAERRARARGRLAISSFMAGGYQGASRSRAGLQGWDPYPGSAETDLHPDVSRLRARSRDLTRNSPIATGAVSGTVTSTIGTGLRPQPRIDRKFLGMSEEEADAWESEASALWDLWAKTTNCDVENELTFYQMQALAFRAVLESGDILSLTRFKELPGSLFGTRLQLIEADRVCNPHYGFDTDGLTGGVEIDRDGMPIAYHVSNRHPGHILRAGPTNWDRLPVYGPSGRRMSRLLFYKNRPGQRRGIPFLAPVIEPLKQLERYSHAELMAAVVSGMFTVFLESEGATGLPSRIGTDVDVDEDAITNDLALGYGAVLELEPGQKIESTNPGRPNAQFDPFVLAILRQTGVALEIPYEVLIGHFQSSYSAARAALLRAYQFYRVRRTWNVDVFSQPSYESVITEAIIRGYLDAPGFFDDLRIRHAFLRAAWTGDAMPQINAVQETKAAQLRVDMGLSTLQEETSNITGGDWEANHAQRVKESRMRREAGLDVEGVAEKVVSESTAKAVGPGEDDPDEAEQREKEEDRK